MRSHLPGSRAVLAAIFALVVACGTPEQLSSSRYPVFYGDPANHALFGVDVSHWEGPQSQFEVDCFWNEGVRHLIAGTQKPDWTRQQLQMAALRGMTIDAYVFLKWRNDIEDQVRAGLEVVKEQPLGRFWLDMEEDQQGGVPTVDLAKRAVAACRASSPVPCGIYTGKGFWQTYLGDTKEMADVPLWYARYNDLTSLSDWTTEKFGGWSFPVGKQFAEKVLCNVGVDQNVIQVVSEPLALVDRTPPPPLTTTPQAPPPPYYPADGTKLPLNAPYGIADEFFRLMVGTAPGATKYEIELQTWNGSSFTHYYTWPTTVPSMKVSPPTVNHLYRFRARAGNTYGFGPWTPFSAFDFGSVTANGPTDCTGKPDGTACAEAQVCSGGTCGSCPLGNLCVSPEVCRTGQVACSAGVPSCQGFVPRKDGATCPGPGTCVQGACGPYQTDGGQLPTDGGAAKDAGTSHDAGALDAGEPDGGPGPSDAGSQADAGSPADPGPQLGSDEVTGCGCQGSPIEGLGLALAAGLQLLCGARARLRARAGRARADR